MEPTAVRIHSPFIRLDAFLKFSGAAATGGHAKILISEGEVAVNGEKTLARGKKLFAGDRVTVDSHEYLVARDETTA